MERIEVAHHILTILHTPSLLVSHSSVSVPSKLYKPCQPSRAALRYLTHALALLLEPAKHPPLGPTGAIVLKSHEEHDDVSRASRDGLPRVLEPAWEEYRVARVRRVERGAERAEEGATALVLGRLVERDRVREQRLVAVRRQPRLLARLVAHEEAIEHAQPGCAGRGGGVVGRGRGRQQHVAQRSIERGQQRG
eukprot:scaffold40405_cov67-Phaeocystis_antarctica.AAC.7